jgi:hypothetical protein
MHVSAMDSRRRVSFLNNGEHAVTIAITPAIHKVSVVTTLLRAHGSEISCDLAKRL